MLKITHTRREEVLEDLDRSGQGCGCAGGARGDLGHCAPRVAARPAPQARHRAFPDRRRAGSARSVQVDSMRRSVLAPKAKTKKRDWVFARNRTAVFGFRLEQIIVKDDLFKFVSAVKLR